MAAPSVDGACQAGGVAVMQKAKGSGLFVPGWGADAPCRAGDWLPAQGRQPLESGAVSAITMLLLSLADSSITFAACEIWGGFS